MNKTIFIGRLTADPELRYTPSGKAVCTFTVAVDRMGKDKGADFIRCQVWEKQAESLNKFKHKGEQVAVQGHLTTGSYERDGKTVQTWHIDCEQIEYIGAPRTAIEPPMNEDNNGFTSNFEDVGEDIPF